MKNSQSIFLVFGATGQTGQHFVSQALMDGHRVKALVRSPEKVAIQNPNLEVHQGSVSESGKVRDLVAGVDFVAAMIGDAKAQAEENINTTFVKQLVPAMRQHGVKRFLYQAGGFTKPYKASLPFTSRLLKNTLVRFSGLLGQHRDNEGVLEFLIEDAADIEWIVHRASILSNGPSKGILKRSKTKFSLATFKDCAVYNYRTITDESAIHSYDLSYYA